MTSLDPNVGSTSSQNAIDTGEEQLETINTTNSQFDMTQMQQYLDMVGMTSKLNIATQTQLQLIKFQQSMMAAALRAVEWK